MVVATTTTTTAVVKRISTIKSIVTATASTVAARMVPVIAIGNVNLLAATSETRVIIRILIQLELIERA